jgi:peroxiredoxin-like protein
MNFVTRLEWSGAARGPTLSPAFSRDLEVSFGNLDVPLSAAPDFRGDGSRVNPEQLFVAAISSCQALTYLYLAARSGIAVVAYSDAAEGELQIVDGKMRMARVTLRPRIVIDQAASLDRARELVAKAHAGCFIANSVATAVTIEPLISAERVSQEVAS